MVIYRIKTAGIDQNPKYIWFSTKPAAQEFYSELLSKIEPHEDKIIELSQIQIDNKKKDRIVDFLNIFAKG